MNNLTKVGIGCGCLPSLLLVLAGSACFVFVAAGFVNYSEEDTAMIIGGLLAAGGFFFALPGIVLLIAGFMQSGSKETKT